MELAKAILILLTLSGFLLLFFQQIDEKTYKKDLKNKPRIMYNFKEELELRALTKKLNSK
tara:strand:- start:700 stop:879 length:180 start_codon:yes stop_codon:yes gene_type:complete